MRSGNVAAMVGMAMAMGGDHIKYAEPVKLVGNPNGGDYSKKYKPSRNKLRKLRRKHEPATAG